MTPEEVNEMCAGIYRAFLKPQYILRQLTRIRSPRTWTTSGAER